jgi:hypothetical protein
MLMTQLNNNKNTGFKSSLLLLKKREGVEFGEKNKRKK